MSAHKIGSMGERKKNYSEEYKIMGSRIKVVKLAHKRWMPKSSSRMKPITCLEITEVPSLQG